MRLRARTHSSPCTPTATPTHPPVCSPSPPAPHEHTKADCGLSQGQVHKTERRLDFCSDLWVIRKAGSQPESACSAWAPTQPADVGTRRRGLAAGESQRHLPGLRPSPPHPRLLAPANSKGFSSLTDSSPEAPASLCSQPSLVPLGNPPTSASPSCYPWAENASAWLTPMWPSRPNTCVTSSKKPTWPAP